MIAIGVGCRRNAAAEDIVALVREALASLQASAFQGSETGKPPPTAMGDMRLFTIADKHDEPGLAAAAAALGMPLVFLDRAVLQMAAGGARSCSRRVEEMFGLPSIAETAALAGAGQGAMLLVERLACPTATCAIAGPATADATPPRETRPGEALR